MFTEATLIAFAVGLFAEFKLKLLSNFFGVAKAVDAKAVAIANRATANASRQVTP